MDAIIIVIGIVAGVLLGVVSNWMYDILRDRHVLPNHPTIKKVVVLVIVCAPLTYFMALPQMRQLSSPTQKPDQAVTELEDFTQSAEPKTPPQAVHSIHTEGDLSGSTIIQSGGGNIYFNEVAPTSELQSQTPPSVSEQPAPPLRIDVLSNNSRCVVCEYVLEEEQFPGLFPDEYLPREYNLGGTDGKVVWIPRERFSKEFEGEGRKNVACNSHVFEIAVTNLARNEWIRVENKPIVSIEAYEVFEGPAHFFSVNMTEGDGSFRDYGVALQSAFSGKEILPVAYSEIPDFYILQPGEQEWFRLGMRCSEPGKYTVKVGVRYIYQGQQGEIWGSSTAEMRMPANYYHWRSDIMVSPVDMYTEFVGIGIWDEETRDWVLESGFIKDEWLISESDKSIFE